MRHSAGRTFNITRLSITKLSHYAECRYDEWHYAECRYSNCVYASYRASLGSCDKNQALALQEYVRPEWTGVTVTKRSSLLHLERKVL